MPSSLKLNVLDTEISQKWESFLLFIVSFLQKKFLLRQHPYFFASHMMRWQRHNWNSYPKSIWRVFYRLSKVQMSALLLPLWEGTSMKTWCGLETPSFGGILKRFKGRIMRHRGERKSWHVQRNRIPRWRGKFKTRSKRWTVLSKRWIAERRILIRTLPVDVVCCAVERADLCT